MKTAYLGLGSNVGDREAHLQAVIERLQAHSDVYVEAASPVYETEAHTRSPSESQPDFLNAVLKVEVEGTPRQLLQLGQKIERGEGRAADAKGTWAPRPLDIDLLMVGDVVCQTDYLTLPHPRLAERRFVLRPWADLAPELIVPSPFNETVQSLLSACPDATSIRRADATLRVEPIA